MSSLFRTINISIYAEIADSDKDVIMIDVDFETYSNSSASLVEILDADLFDVAQGISQLFVSSDGETAFEQFHYGAADWVNKETRD